MDRQSSKASQAASGNEVSRRVFAGAVGVAAIGSVLAESGTALAAGGTTVESAAVAPAVVELTDGSTIAVNASLGNDFRVTLGGNRTFGNPSNATDGQQIIFQITQGSGGPFTVSWGSAYEFAPGLPAPTLSTTAGQTDLLGFVYNAAIGTWLFAAFVNGFD